MPTTLNQIVGREPTKNLVTYLKNIVEKRVQDSPPLLISGPTGIGKSAVINAFLNEYYTKFNISRPDEINLFRKIEGSIERSSEALRNSGTFLRAKLPRSDIKKILVIENVDDLTEEAQALLIYHIKKYSINTLMILVADSIDRINPRLRKMCIEFPLVRLSASDVKAKLDEILNSERIKLNNDVVLQIAEESSGDLNKAINTLFTKCNTVTNDVNINYNQDAESLVGWNYIFSPTSTRGSSYEYIGKKSAIKKHSQQVEIPPIESIASINPAPKKALKISLKRIKGGYIQIDILFSNKVINLGLFNSVYLCRGTTGVFFLGRRKSTKIKGKSIQPIGDRCRIELSDDKIPSMSKGTIEIIKNNGEIESVIV